MKKLETSIQNPILKKLRKLKPSIWFKIHDFFTSGIPDIVGLYKGRFIAIEVKRPGKKPTALQYRILKIINRCGGIALWTDNTYYIDIKIKEWEQW